MKKLIVLLLLISSTASAQMELAEDYSFQQDKKMHVGVGIGISAGMFMFVNNKTNDVDLAFRAAWMSGSFAGMSKEWYDIIRGKEASLADLSYTVLGSLTTAFIMRGIVKIRNKKRAKRNKQLRIALNIN
jgi:VanZ family protein